VVAHERRAALAVPCIDVAGLGAGANARIVAVGVRVAAGRGALVDAAARVVVGRRVTAVRRAHDAVVTGRRRAWHARPIRRVAGLGAGAGARIVAVGVRGAAGRDGRIHASAGVVVGRRVTAVGRAHDAVVAGRGRAWHARPIRRVAGLEAVAEEAVVAGDVGG